MITAALQTALILKAALTGFQHQLVTAFALFCRALL